MTGKRKNKQHNMIDGKPYCAGTNENLFKKLKNNVELHAVKQSLVTASFGFLPRLFITTLLSLTLTLS